MEWHSETWQEKGDGFLVEIKHWKGEGFDETDNAVKVANKWNVYAYIYPKHKIFVEIESDDLFIRHVIREYFHYSLSFHEWIFNKDGKLTCKKLGSDYEHLDDYYIHSDKLDDVPCGHDAERLIKYLKSETSKKETT